jgi:hypothetical protein
MTGFFHQGQNLFFSGKWVRKLRFLNNSSKDWGAGAGNNFAEQNYCLPCACGMPGKINFQAEVSTWVPAYSGRGAGAEDASVSTACDSGGGG